MRLGLSARIVPAFLSLTVLTALSCSSETSSDSAICRRYKAALLSESFDVANTTPTVDGSYDAYRCPSAAEFVAQGEYTSLEACAEYLEGLDGLAPLNGRATCKLGVLLWDDRSAQVSARGVGTACTLTVAPAAGNVYFEWAHPECGDGATCANERSSTGTDGYCTCRCDAASADLPVCACPDGFSCELDAIRTGGAGARGGYCVRR